MRVFEQMSKSLRSPLHRAVVAAIVASRHDAKLTQEDLAHRLGWHRTRISKVESGERRIDVPEFIVIAEALELPPELLFARVLRWLDAGTAPAALANPQTAQDAAIRAAADVNSLEPAALLQPVKLLESLVKSLDPGTRSPYPDV